MLFGIIVLVTILTHILPAGSYERVLVDGRSTVVPNSYRTITATPVWILDMFKAIPLGFKTVSEIIFIVLAGSIMFGFMEKSKAVENAIIGEPSLMGPIFAQKGIYILETYINGSIGHSSRIKLEVSAIHESMRLILWLENRMDQLIADQGLDERFHPPHSTIHIGEVAGGIAPNVIADKAHFFWNLRTIPMDNIEAIVAEFEAYCMERENELHQIFPGFTIKTIENHPLVPHLDTKADDEVVALIKRL